MTGFPLNTLYTDEAEEQSLNLLRRNYFYKIKLLFFKSQIKYFLYCKKGKDYLVSSFVNIFFSLSLSLSSSPLLLIPNI